MNGSSGNHGSYGSYGSYGPMGNKGIRARARGVWKVTVEDDTRWPRRREARG